MNVSKKFDLLGNTVALETILSKATYTEEDIVFLSGSLISGLGNKYSDLDIFVLSKKSLDAKESQYEYEFKNSKVEYAAIGNIRCDIEYWNFNELLEIIAEINHADLEDEAMRVVNILKSVRLADASFILNRLITGVCIYNQTEFNKLLSHFDTNKFFRIMTRNYVIQVDNGFEDIIGNLDMERYQSAVMIGREILPLILIAYLSSKKVSIIKTKWVFPLLAKLAENDPQAAKILNNFKKVYFEANLKTQESMLTNARQILRLINQVISEIENNLGGL